jgi:hypothetical protein
MLDGLKRALESLRNAGCRRACIDGSFVTAKKHPSDSTPAGKRATSTPFSLILPSWTSLISAEQKERFGGELFPATMPAGPGYPDFLDYFQHEGDTAVPKGIVTINLKDPHDHQ